MISEKSALLAAGESHPGLRRRKNEDSFCLAFSRDGKKLLAVVADGIGGHNRGEKASYICCRELVSSFLREAAGGLENAEQSSAFLRQELDRINGDIYIRNRANRTVRPMGTTVNCCIFCGEKIVMANAGDSRFYECLPDGKAAQLSVDHSYKAFSQDHMIEGMENVIYRALGLHRNFEFDLEVFPFSPEKRYLLCTDGLYRYVGDEQIGSCLKEAASPGTALNVFMRSALIAGGRDNITGIAVFPQNGK